MEGSGDTARTIGFWLAGFVIPTLAGYVLLRLARSPRRGRVAAALLRLAAPFAALFLVYANYVGNSGRMNLGGLLALVVVVAWTIREQARGGRARNVPPE